MPCAGSSGPGKKERIPMKKCFAFLAALALLLTCGCGAKPATEPTTVPATPTDAATEKPTAEQTGFQFTLDNYPRMGGSLANLPLGTVIFLSISFFPPPA